MAGQVERLQGTCDLVERLGGEQIRGHEMEPGAALLSLADFPCAVPAAGRAAGAHASVCQGQAVLPLHRRHWLEAPLSLY